VGSYEGLRGYHMLPEASAGSEEQDPTYRAEDVARVAGLTGITHAAELSQVALLPEEMTAQKDLFPEGRLDQDLQQVDLRGRNSWRLLLAEVSTVELLEVQLVNAVAPFVFNATAQAAHAPARPERDKHIVNVSAVEGQFYRNFKTTRHPHTNMAKAALNMMTRTAAADYHHDGIHMNSVDTGWGDRRGPGRDCRAQDHRAAIPSTARHRRRRRPHRGPDHQRLQHRNPHLGPVFSRDYKPVDW
jgi:NAD(P)-dependent dehydrogenase (short-subunit alcohol dehydrogenase family)